MEEITIVDVESMMVLGMRKRGKYEEIGQMVQRLAQYAGEKGIQIQGPPIYVGHEMSHEEAIKADQEGTADLEVAFPVGGSVEATAEFKYYQLPGGKMAKTTHKGPYEDCGPTYERLFAWLGENRKNVAGPIREVYLNDPRAVPQEEILTDIYAPLE